MAFPIDPVPPLPPAESLEEPLRRCAEILEQTGVLFVIVVQAADKACRMRSNIVPCDVPRMLDETSDLLKSKLRN